MFHEVAEVGAVIIGRDRYGHFRLAIMRVIESNDQPVICLGFLDGCDHGIWAVDRHEGIALGHRAVLRADLFFAERLVEDIAFFDYTAAAEIVEMGHE